MTSVLNLFEDWKYEKLLSPFFCQSLNNTVSPFTYKNLHWILLQLIWWLTKAQGNYKVIHMIDHILYKELELPQCMCVLLHFFQRSTWFTRMKFHKKFQLVRNFWLIFTMEQRQPVTNIKILILYNERMFSKWLVI